MNRKGYLWICRYSTFLDLKAGSIEFSMVSQERKQFRIGFDDQDDEFARSTWNSPGKIKRRYNLPIQ